MKAPKNFEGIFVAAALITTLAAYATAKEPVSYAAAPAVAAATAEAGAMAVVVVKAKRLTAAEKAALN